MLWMYNLNEFIKIHGVRGTARRVGKAPTTIQRWKDSGKTFYVRTTDKNKYQVLEEK